LIPVIIVQLIMNVTSILTFTGLKDFTGTQLDYVKSVTKETTVKTTPKRFAQQVLTNHLMGSLTALSVLFKLNAQEREIQTTLCVLIMTDGHYQEVPRALLVD